MRTVRADTHGLAATDTRLAARPERIVRRGSYNRWQFGLPNEALDLGRCGVRGFECWEVGYTVQPLDREPRIRGRELLLAAEEPGGARLGVQDGSHTASLAPYRDY